MGKGETEGLKSFRLREIHINILHKKTIILIFKLGEECFSDF